MPTSSSSAFRGGFDMTATTEELEHVATLIPDEWLAPMATGHPSSAWTRCWASSTSAATA